jgi:hypothetical protein
MGTTLANLHIFDGDEQQVRALYPAAVVGRWSTRFVSVYSREFIPGASEKTAKDLLKKLSQPVLYAWVFDSDAVGFFVYRNGKTVTEHIMNPDGYSKMGNIANFCETLGLPVEDMSRLRFIWKKGDAEEQLELTAALLGAPLYHDCEILPDRQYTRNVQVVDAWIAERPAPPTVKNETKAVVLQELTHFRWFYNHGSTQYCSAEPYEDGYAYDKCQFWISNADGTISPGWSSNVQLDFHSSQDRIIGVSDGHVAYDSTGLLPDGYKLNEAGFIYLLADGGFLGQQIQKSNGENITLFTRFASDGSGMWIKRAMYPGVAVFACENNEIIFNSDTENTSWLERVDDLTGVTIEKILRPFGINAWSKACHKGSWWIAHDGFIFKDEQWQKQGNALMKLNKELQPLAQIPLPIYTQGLFFSPDDAYIYVFFHKSQVMAVNTETLVAQNVLNDKSYLGPLGFDAAGRFWLQRDNSTVEAWDAALTKTFSRHRLKGQIMGHHFNAQGLICVVAWQEKEKILRIYKMEE